MKVPKMYDASFILQTLSQTVLLYIIEVHSLLISWANINVPYT